jgi:hypothetical protein
MSLFTGFLLNYYLTLIKKIETGDFDWVQNVFIYCEWCFKQRSRNPDIWNVTATAFLEHLADEDERVELIPRWLKPDIFEDMWDEVKKQRERKGAGLAQKLLDEYNKANNSKEEYQQYL